jgi:hypothetical protein
VTGLFATVDPKNARSIRLLARLGFVEIAPSGYPHGEAEPEDRVFSLSCTPGFALGADQDDSR